MKISDLKKHIRDIPNFPQEGIVFKDISTLIKNKDAFKKSIDILAKKYKSERVELLVCWQRKKSENNNTQSILSLK